MALTAKDILGTAASVSRRAIAAGTGAVRRMRNHERGADVAPAPATPSPAPEAVGAPRPGGVGGPKSSTAAKTRTKAKPAAGPAKPGAAAKVPEAAPAADTPPGSASTD